LVSRISAWVIRLLGGTPVVSRTLPPMEDPVPTTSRPRLVAPAYITTSSSAMGWRSIPLMGLPSASRGKPSAPSVTPW
jgi:hypothetical protein